jgi:hypothetical protein
MSKGYLVFEFICIFGLTFLSAIGSRWFAPEALNFSPIWPVTGIAIAVISYRPLLTIACAFGLFSWAIFELNQSVLWALALTCTLTGPLAIAYIKQRFGIHRKLLYIENTSQLKLDFFLIFIVGIVPSSVIGSALFWLNTPTPFYDILMVYLISDCAGVLLFIPIIQLFFLQKPLTNQITIQDLVKLTLMSVSISALPYVFHFLSFESYAQASYLLILPFAAWLATMNSRHLMALGLFVVSIAHLLLTNMSIGVLNEINHSTLILATLLIVYSRYLWIFFTCE